MDQDVVDDGVKTSLGKIGQELVRAHLLGHKDKGVRAGVGCCVVDILRLCAPDAPYTHKQLKVNETLHTTALFREPRASLPMLRSRQI